MKRNVKSTSQQCYRSISPEDLSDRQQSVLVAIHAYPDSTDSEIAQFLGFSDPNKVRPRRYELADLQLIVCSGKRVCRVSGELAMTWRVRQWRVYQHD